MSCPRGGSAPLTLSLGTGWKWMVTSHLVRFTLRTNNPDTLWAGGWVGSGVGHNFSEKQYLYYCWGIETLIFQPLSQSLCWLRYCGSRVAHILRDISLFIWKLPIFWPSGSQTVLRGSLWVPEQFPVIYGYISIMAALRFTYFLINGINGVGFC
jgi:hypothetical protein